MMLLTLGFPLHSAAQFYNGSQLSFGKNRVQYKDFLWTYYSFDKFDTYFYRNGKELAQYTARYAKDHIDEIELKLESTLDDKIQFIIFNNLSDLKQSNIGLMQEEQYNTGGITHIIGKKVFLYFDGSHTDFEKQIRAGISSIIFKQMMFGQRLGSQIKNNTLYTMPGWYEDGLISWLSEGWNTEVDNRVRDGILSGRYEKFNHLTGTDAIDAGHSLWKYIADNFGSSAVPNVVHMTKVTRSVENGFLYVVGLSFKNLIQEWKTYYMEKYSTDESGRYLPADVVQHKIKNNLNYSRPVISPDGNFLAYGTNEMGKYKVYLKNILNGKRKCIMRGGYKLDEKTDYSYPLIAWHPVGEVMAIIVEKKGEIYLYFYTLDEKKYNKIILYNFEKILDLSYSPDGRKLLISAVQKGQSDIFLFNISSGSHEQITDDIFDDLQPRFIDKGRMIIFSSNRISDTLPEKMAAAPEVIPLNYDLFAFDYHSKNNVLRRVTNTRFANERYPMDYSNGRFTYLSDENGIYNRYIARFDSAIIAVDTTIHFRYFTESVPVTNYTRNILFQDVNTNTMQLAQVVYDDHLYKIFMEDVIHGGMPKAEKLVNTAYMDLLLGPRTKPGVIRPEPIPEKPDKPPRQRFFNVYEGDTINVSDQEINIENYVFERQAFVNAGETNQTVWNAEADSTREFVVPKRLNYRVEYSMNEFVTQIDFNFINMTYQPFAGGGAPIFLNPGFNALFRVGMTDLLEDYRIVGGVRLNINLINNEYIFSYSNLKHRLDKEIILHRVTVENVTGYDIIRNHSHEAYYMLKWPFSPVFAVRGTASYRHDTRVVLSTDRISLKEQTLHRNWGGLKGELIYDNTRKLGLNLFEGTRYKVFGEYYQQIEKGNQQLIVLGLDFRNYIKIHRTFIWANRFAASTSLGHNKLIYYMGGVDNWLAPKFNRETPIEYSQNYAFQTLATNMRGFHQNIRNGNNFVLINSELRMPLFKYLYNRPIKSDFLNNFQMVGFVDAGTAWTSWNPYSAENSLYTKYIYSGSLLIRVEYQRDPMVGGFGFGLRSRILGYFMRGDLAWGVEDGRIHKPVFYFSLSLDF
jgi:Tol biopolymer transport system component